MLGPSGIVKERRGSCKPPGRKPPLPFGLRKAPCIGVAVGVFLAFFRLCLLYASPMRSLVKGAAPKNANTAGVGLYFEWQGPKRD